MTLTEKSKFPQSTTNKNLGTSTCRNDPA